MKSKKVKGKKEIEEAETEEIEEKEEIEAKEEEEEKEIKEKGGKEEKFDFQLETVTHAEHVTPVLEAKPKFKLENFLETVETKKEEEKPKEVKYSPSLYGEGPKYFGEREEQKDWGEQQAESFRTMIRPKTRASDIREVAEINIRPERRARETPFIQTERFEEIIKYEKAEKQVSRPQELEPEFKEKQKKIKKYEPIYSSWQS